MQFYLLPQGDKRYARVRRLQHKFVCCDWWCCVLVSLLLLLLHVDAKFVCKKNAINSIQIQLNGLDAHTLQPIGNKRPLLYGEILTHRHNDCGMLSDSRPKTNYNSRRKLRQRSMCDAKVRGSHRRSHLNFVHHISLTLCSIAMWQQLDIIDQIGFHFIDHIALRYL